MSEKKRSPHQSGSEKGNVSQNYGHLYDKTADELLTELEARMDEMTDLTYDEDVVDSYLAALDEKAPLEEDFNVERSWEKFRSQHGIFFDEGALTKSATVQRKSHPFCFRKRVARAAVVAAIIAVFSMLCAQAAGFDVLGAIGRWSEETFRFSIPSSSVPPTVQNDNLFTTPKEYTSLQEAFNAYSITEPLAPTWVPEGYTLDYVEALPSSGQILFTASYSDSQNTLSLSYSYWTDNVFRSSTFEKDGSSVVEYTKNGIVHYIMSNVDVRVAAWVNGTCECSIFGPLSDEEMIAMIDSIYLRED